MNNGYIITKKTCLCCPMCGHPLVMAKIENIDTLYCEKCKEDIYEEDMYENRREQTYKDNNRRKSLEDLL